MQNSIRILKPYIRGIPIIILVMVTAFFMANQYLNYTAPMYESMAKLRLADMHNGVPSSNLFKNLDVFASVNRIAAEIEVLKSDVLLNKVLDKLDYEIEIFRKGKIKTLELYNQSPLLIQYLKINNRTYDKLFDIKILSLKEYTLVNPENRESYTGIMGDSLVLPNITLIINLNDSLLKQKPNLDVLDNYQFKILSRQELLNKVKKRLDVSAVDKDVPIINIYFKSPSPIKSSKLVNTLTELYIEDYIEDRYKAAKTTVNFLNDRINDILIRLSKSEINIQNYRDKKNITNIYQETETDLRQLAQLEILQANVRMELKAIQSLDSYIKEGEDDFLDLAPNFEAFNDLLSTELVKKIKELQAEKRDMLLSYTPINEKIIAIDGKIKDLTNYLSESIGNTRNSLEIQYKNLSARIEVLKNVFKGIPEKEKNLGILYREFEIYQESYNFLNEKMLEAEIAQAAKISFHRIISYAQIPIKSVSPIRIIIKISATIFGMFFAIMMIYIVHMLKGKVNNKHTVESRSLIDIAMFTPLLKSKLAIENHFLQQVVQLEIKGLISNKSIVCVSAFNQKEGAKFNSFHLAEAMSNQNKNVLFIDVDNSFNFMEIEKENPVKLKINLDLITLTDPLYNRYTESMMQLYIKNIEKEYDIILILNEKLGDQKSMLFMSIATTNLIVLDTRLTPAKKIIEVDILKEEYKFKSIHFILNRHGYIPNVVKEVYGSTLKMIQKIKDRIKKR